MIILKFFVKFDFRAPEALFSVFELIFRSTRCFTWLVEQDGPIPTRRVIRCQGNLHFWGLRQIGKAKHLKSKINLGSYIQIWIWIHFRIELELKYISSGRVSGSIDFIEVENWFEARRSELKKNDHFENFRKSQFSSSGGFVFSFRIAF